MGHNKAGSAEGWASGGGMAQVAVQSVLRAGKNKQKTVRRLRSSRTPARNITARSVGLAARKGDAVALEILAATGRRLGAVLAILVDSV